MSAHPSYFPPSVFLPALIPCPATNFYGTPITPPTFGEFIGTVVRSSCDKKLLNDFYFCTYKTELCARFNLNGQCEYNEKCRFAHGQGELRHRIRPSTYKTKKCYFFHTLGSCKYEGRCIFLHNDIKILLPNTPTQ